MDYGNLSTIPILNPPNSIGLGRNLATIQWNVKRILSKTNYQIHTDAIKNVVIPQLTVAKQRESLVYASEADLLNLALFGCTARQWEEQNPQYAGKLNMRDLASINQLVVLSNMESSNAEMLKQGVERTERFQILSRMAKEQLDTLNRCNAEHRFRKFLPSSESKLLNAEEEN